MVTHEEHQALTDRVEKVEREVREYRNESLAGQFSLLRAYVNSHHDDSLKPGMLALLAQLERRVRPLSIALERAQRIESDHAALLDQVTPARP